MGWGKSFCQGCSLWALGDAWVELAVCLHVSTTSSSVTSCESDICSSLQPLGQPGKIKSGCHKQCWPKPSVCVSFLCAQVDYVHELDK